MSWDTLQIRLLGPVDVTIGGITRPLSGLRRKTVLAVVGLHPGETVSTDRLIDIVWGENPPATAANTLQSHVSYLRGVLGARAAIVARPPGYLLDLPAEATDVALAEQLIRQSRKAVDPAQSAARLRAALDLWRGQSLADVAGVSWLDEQAARLEHLRLEAVQALVEARMAMREHAQLVPELEVLAEQHPFREHIHQQLMLALYRSGRQADALGAYQRLRRTISLELGIDPSPALRDLELAILRQDAVLDPPQSIALAPTSTAGATPAQLPLAATSFTGRTTELARLDDVLAVAAEVGTACSPAVTVTTVSGTAGVGKTALAVHWAHEVAPQFPDGQLYVNLRGFDPGGSVMDPAEAIRGFLDAFGVPAERIPTTVDSQASLYRSVLANKRVLIVIDNARDDEQVRPLLPGSPGCLVVVTSRNQLTGLVATEGAFPLSLDLPSATDARDMLSRRLGAGRVAAEPEAVDEIIARCARLPLALAVAAARAATHTGLPLATLAAQLQDTAVALDQFHSTDVATDVRAVFSWSYHTLSAGAARLFRCLGLAPGADISLAAAASLVGLGERQVRGLLAELTNVHLLTEPSADRYAFHDLLCAYAMEQASIHDTDDQLAAALHRVLDHYLHTAHAAALLLSPNRDPITLNWIQPGAVITDLADRDEAMAWFTAELPVLLATVGQELEEFDWCGWQLAWTLTTFLDRRGYWHDNVTVQHVALENAVRTNDIRGQAYAHRHLASIKVKLGQLADAGYHNQRALTLFGEIGDRITQAHVHLSFAWIADQQGDFIDALSHAQLALRPYQEADHRSGRAHALNIMGWCHANLGSYELALAYGNQAIALFLELGDRQGSAGTWDSLGFLHFQLGNSRQAVECYQQAIDIYREMGDQFNEADTFGSLGDGYAAAGELGAARRAWHQAVTLLDQLHHAGAATLRAKLRAATTPTRSVDRVETIPADQVFAASAVLHAGFPS